MNIEGFTLLPKMEVLNFGNKLFVQWCVFGDVE